MTQDPEKERQQKIDQAMKRMVDEENKKRDKPLTPEEREAWRSHYFGDPKEDDQWALSIIVHGQKADVERFMGDIKKLIALPSSNLKLEQMEYEEPLLAMYGDEREAEREAVKEASKP
jgi:hypothetical protein